MDTCCVFCSKRFLKKKDKSLLDSLIGWNPHNILKIKERLFDFNLKWASNLNECIPREKYGQKVKNQEFNRIIEGLKNLKKK